MEFTWQVSLAKEDVFWPPLAHKHINTYILYFYFIFLSWTRNSTFKVLEYTRASTTQHKKTTIVQKPFLSSYQCEYPLKGITAQTALPSNSLACYLNFKSLYIVQPHCIHSSVCFLSCQDWTQSMLHNCASNELHTSLALSTLFVSMYLSGHATACM